MSGLGFDSQQQNYMRRSSVQPTDGASAQIEHLVSPPEQVSGQAVPESTPKAPTNEFIKVLEANASEQTDSEVKDEFVDGVTNHYCTKYEIINLSAKRNS